MRHARFLTPTDRHLNDEVIRKIAEADGVMGAVFYNGFLEHRWEVDPSISVTLAEHARRHASYLASVAGWGHVSIGSDLDGDLGLEESPEEVDSVADLYKVGEVVPLEARACVLSGNWLPKAVTATSMLKVSR